MRNMIYTGIVCLCVLLVADSLSFALGQSPIARRDTNAESARPRQPGGKLGEHLGVYRTVEGFRSVGGKVETGTLLVDTVDGVKLDKPIPLVIRGGVVVDHNLREAVLPLPANQRCIFKGFETGEMIGVPPAVSEAAQEQGWKGVPASAPGWQWRPYFVALVVVEPKGLELDER
jgi:hypothetical protein